MNAATRMRLDVAEATAEQRRRAHRPWAMSVAEAEARIRFGLTEDHVYATQLPGWEGFGAVGVGHPAAGIPTGSDGPTPSFTLRLPADLDTATANREWGKPQAAGGSDDPSSSAHYRGRMHADPTTAAERVHTTILEPTQRSAQCDCVAAGEQADPFKSGMCYKQDPVFSGYDVWDPTVVCWPHNGGCRCLEDCGTEDEGGPRTPYDVDPALYGCMPLPLPPNVPASNEFYPTGVELFPESSGAEAIATRCHIWVGATPVIRSGKVLGWHTLVYHFDRTNNGTIIAGEPDHDRMSLCPVFGHITVESKSTSGVVGLAVLAESSEAACDKLVCLEAERARINAAGICYSLPSPNSNSAAYTLLANCGVPTVKPAVSTPGWGVLI